MIVGVTEEREQAPQGEVRAGAFTLIELLVVIGIIAALSIISLPAIRGLGQSNVMTSGTQQLVDDLMLARHKAMVGRTTVYVVFVPESVNVQPPGALSGTQQQRERKLWERLRGGAFTTYALYVERTLGDQPGHRNNRYITDWRTLPEGVFIATAEYDRLPAGPFAATDPIERPFATEQFPYPTERSPVKWELPYVAFDQNGSLIQRKGVNNRAYKPEYITMAKGSVLVARLSNGGVSIDAREVPLFNSISNYNRIRIDQVSGRARLERPEIEVGD